MMKLAVVLLLAVTQADGEADRLRGLVRALAADFLEEREAARASLQKAGAAAEPYLIEGLDASDFRIRKASLDLLALLGSVKARARGAALFENDPDLSVRDAAFELVKALGKEAEDHLIAALGSDRRRYRLEAVKVLTDIKSSKAAEPVAALFERQGEPEEIKDAAFACMKALGKPAHPFLLKHMTSPEAKVRRACLEGLHDSKSDAVLEAVGNLFVAEADGAVLQLAFLYLKEAGPKAEPHFLEGLKSVHEEVRHRSITGLQELKSEPGLETIALLFRKDRSETIRKAAAEFLEALGLKAEGALIEALESKTPEVRLKAIESLGKIKSEKPLVHIGRLFREDKDPDIHRRSFDYLRRLGKAAEKDLLFALKDEDKRIRRDAIRALGEARSEAAIEPLLEFMAQLDPALRSESRTALVKIGLPALEAVTEAAEKGRIKKGEVEELLALFYHEEVERLLSGLVTESGGTGTYAGQFQALKEFGARKAFPALIKIARDPMPAFRPKRAKIGADLYGQKMREMAIMALGALGEAEAVAPLREVLATLPPDLSLNRADTVQDELVLALWRLGEKAPLQKYLKDVQAVAEKALKENKIADGCEKLFYVGLIQNRVGEREKSRAAYTRLLEVYEEHNRTAKEPLTPKDVDVVPSTYYNLACLASLGGRKAEAVTWLEKAVRAGFKDREWIGIDGELNGIRGEEGYKKLLADDSLFEKKR